MQLRVNGHDERLDFTEVTAQPTVADLLRLRGVATQNLVVELDGVILAQGDYEVAILHEGSTVELLRFVGGG